MKLLDVSEETRPTFLRCLHDERPDDPRVIALRRKWVDQNSERGLRAKVLILDSGEVAGLCQYLPIEHSHLQGKNLLAILCMWVHGYDHHIGNRQGNGYGRFMLDGIEADARALGVSGIAAWGMDFPYWNPVSFYEHMGYVRADQEKLAVLVWKPLSDDAKPPRFVRPRRKPRVAPDKVTVTVLYNGWCSGSCGECIKSRDAVDGLEAFAVLEEVDTSDQETLLEWGISTALFVDGKPHRPQEPPCSSEVLRSDLLAIAREKGLLQD